MLGIGVYSNFISLCFEYCIKDQTNNKITICGLLTMAFVLAMFFIFRFTYTAFYDFVTGGFFYYIIAVQYVLPIVLLCVVNIKDLRIMKKSQKNNEKLLKNSKKIAIFMNFPKIEQKFCKFFVVRQKIKIPAKVQKLKEAKAVKT